MSKYKLRYSNVAIRLDHPKLNCVEFLCCTLSASSRTTTVALCSQLLRLSTISWSNCLMNKDKEVVENKLLRRPRISLWCWWEAHKRLWRPTNSAMDFIYLFVNLQESLFKIAFADSVLETNTCVSPNMLVLKQFPYLSHTTQEYSSFGLHFQTSNLIVRRT